MSDNLPIKSDDTWMEIAQTLNGFEADFIVGFLQTANIPTYIEHAYGLPSTFFGQSSPKRIFVPAEFYEEARDLLDDDDDDDDLLYLDEPTLLL